MRGPDHHAVCVKIRNCLCAIPYQYGVRFQHTPSRVAASIFRFLKPVTSSSGRSTIFILDDKLLSLTAPELRALLSERVIEINASIPRRVVLSLAEIHKLNNTHIGFLLSFLDHVEQMGARVHLTDCCESVLHKIRQLSFHLIFDLD